MSGRFIAVVGPSGVGKDSVMTALTADDLRLVLARRVITRPEDAGGEDFCGVSEEEFTTRETAGGFALGWRAHGLCYAIPAEVDAHLLAGRDVLANLSRSVLAPAQERFQRLEVIVLTADRAALAARLAARGREAAEEVVDRLNRTVPALPFGLRIHEVDNSGPLKETVEVVKACLFPDGDVGPRRLLNL